MLAGVLQALGGLLSPDGTLLASLPLAPTYTIE